MSGEERSLPLPFEPSAAPVWIDAATVARLAGIDERRVRTALAKCAAGGTWRQHALKVRTKDGGPASAQNPYLVHVNSLPPALAGAYYERHAKAAELVEVKTGPALPMPTTLDPKAAKKRAEKLWKLGILMPALECTKGTRARGQALTSIANAWHVDLSGKRKKIGKRTLEEWIQKLEKAGDPAVLARKDREEKPDRNMICRDWDAACPLPHETKLAIAAELRGYVRGLWAKMPGCTVIEQLASSKLMEACWAAGWAAATYELCRVGRYFVEKHSEPRILYIKDKDAKRWSDEFIPRIKRTREGMRPGDLVVGDVHPVDILVRRADGSEATPRLIGWYDLATGDLFCSVVLYPKLRAPTQADVTALPGVNYLGRSTSIILAGGSEA